MSPDQFQQLALRTESNRFPLDDGRCNTDLYQLNRLLHAGLGLTTEAGEFVDPLKKRLFYCKPLDLVNLKEELGDLLWYVAIACDALGTTVEQVMETVIAKLQHRYPDKFSDVAAINRDLDGERAVLEKGQ